LALKIYNPNNALTSSKKNNIILAGFIYTLVFIIYTFPLILKFDSAFIGDPNGDASQFFWNAYHFKAHFPDISKIIYTNDILYPEGGSLLINSNAYIYGLTNLFFQNPYFSFNLVVGLAFVLSGITAYLLARKYIDNNFLCLLAGFVFAFSPYKLIRITGHYNLILTFTIPLIFLLFTQLVSVSNKKLTFHPNTKKILYLGGLLGFSLLLDYVVFFHTFYLCAAYFFSLILLTVKWENTPKKIGIVLITFVVAHFLIRGLRLLGIDDRGAFWWRNDIVAFFIPSYESRFFSTNFFKSIYTSEWFYAQPLNIESVVFLGYTLIIIGFAACIFFIKKFEHIPFEIKALLITLFILCMLSIPSFKILGKDLFNMPTSIIHFIPFLNNVRIPSRTIMLTSLLLPILSFYYINSYIKTKYLMSNRRLNLITAVLGILLFFEFYPTPYMFTEKKDMPSFVHILEKDTSACSVLTIPTGVKDGNKMLGIFKCNNLWHQTVHKHPIIGGYTSRMSEKVFERYKENNVMNELLHFSSDTSFLFSNTMESTFPNMISQNAIGYIVISPSHRNIRLESLIYNSLLTKNISYSSLEKDGYMVISIE
jgi:hypothetical protein